MTIADRLIRRRPRDTGPPVVSAPSAPGAAAAQRRSTAADDLRRRRDGLARRFADLQWDLGGMAYEMASRDHFRLDVLTRQAAQLQQVDAELGETERLLHLDEAGAAGSCGSCGSLYARGAAFCWSCGASLIAPSTPAAGIDA